MPDRGGSRHRRRWLAAAFGVLVAMAAAHDAAAYCRTTTCNPKKDSCRKSGGCVRSGSPIAWRVMPIPYRFHARPPERLDPDEARGAIRLAFERWTEVVCHDGRRTSLRFQELPEIPESKPRGKEPFGIYFRDDGWPHDNVDETLALTTHLFSDASGAIAYADMEVNSREHQFALRDTDTKGKDLEAVMTHEVGHYIGLAHSPDPESIMVPAYCQSDSRCTDGLRKDRKALERDLGADDVSAVCALFPPDGPLAVATEPAGCAAGGTTESSTGTAAVVAGAAVLLVAGRRRRHSFRFS